MIRSLPLYLSFSFQCARNSRGPQPSLALLCVRALPLFAFLLTSLATVVVDAKAQGARLAASDDNVQFSNGVLRHHRYDDIDLYTRSLHGISYAVGPVELQYNESYPDTGGYFHDRAGNFDLKSVNFEQGIVVGLPRVYANWIYDGVLRYRLGPTRPSGSQGGYGDYQFQTLISSGRYVAIDIGFPDAQLHDTELGLNYHLRLHDVDGSWIPYEIVTESGHVVEVTWNETLSQHGLPLPASFRLSMGGIELERLELSYTTSGPRPRLTSINSFLNGQFAAWRSVWLGYLSSGHQPEFILNRLFLGANGSGPLQPNLVPSGLRLSYGTAGNKDILLRLNNYQNKQLKEFLLSEVPVPPFNLVRTVYSGIRIGGPTRAPTTLVYQLSGPSGQDRSAIVTSPLRPNDPLTMDLDSEIGTLVRMSRASCPNPLYQATYSNGGPSSGYLESEQLRHECDKLLTRTFVYSPQGFLEGIETVGVGSDGQPLTRSFSMATRSTLTASGTRSYRLTETTDTFGRSMSWDYDDKGRMTEEWSSEPGDNIQTHYSFWDSAGTQVQSVVHTFENARQSEALFSQAGLLLQTSEAANTPDEVTQSYLYDPMLRAQALVDYRGNQTTLSYDENGNLERLALIPSGGEEHVTTTYSFHPDFPQTVRRVDIEWEKGGLHQSGFSELTFLSDTPVATKQVLGGSSTTPLTAWSTEFDPSTLRLTRYCMRPDFSSNSGCQNFNFRADGVFAGLPHYVDYAGGLSSGGYRRTFLYGAFTDLIGSRVQDQALDYSTYRTFDDFGRLRQAQSIPASGSPELLEYRFDANDRLVGQRKFIGGILTSDLQQEFLLNGASDRPARFEDLVSELRTTYEYADSFGRLTRARTTIGDSRLQEDFFVDAGSFDSFNRPRTFSRFVDGAGSLTWQANWNTLGDLVSRSDERGNPTIFEYDSFGRMTHQLTPLFDIAVVYGISSNGRFIRTISTERTTNSSLRTPHTTEAALDAIGRVSALRDETRGLVRTYTHGARGLVESALLEYPDEDSRIIQQDYDSFDREVSRSINGVPLFSREYSGVGLLLALQDSRQERTELSYDGMGRRSAISYPDGSRLSYEAPVFFYPALPNGSVLRTRWNDRGGSTVTAEFDTFGQPVLFSASSGPLGSASRLYSYDALRPIAIYSQQADGASALLSYEYDSLGRPVGESSSVSSSTYQEAYTLGKDYDQFGRLVRYDYPTTPPTRVDYLRDQFGRVREVRVNDAPIQTSIFDGPVLVGETLGEVLRLFEYDSSTGELARARDTVGSSTLSDLRFDYSAAGRLTVRDDFGLRRGALPSTHETFRYNDLGMLEEHHAIQPRGRSGSRLFYPEADGVLGLIPNANEMFELTSLFSYDAFGNPTHSTTGNFQFQWSPLGLRTLSRPSVSALFAQDAIGRNVLHQKVGTFSSTQTTQVRDRGMVLYQRETLE